MRNPSRTSRRALWPRSARGRAAITACLGLVLSLGLASPASAAVTGFDPENIISDGLFYDGAAMSSAEIQSFLDGKIGECRNGKCLNVLTTGISSREAVHSQSTGNLICSAIQGGTMKVSELIYRVQVACGISAKVILVTLQKEQGLTTSKEPSDGNLKAAMGASCPDTAPCDPSFAGVGPQILKGAQQLKTYKAARFAKQPGANFVAFHPNQDCGGTTLDIKNYATAALYSYTPYQPNAASLQAGDGIGDSCSSYGNRNFFRFYTQWFGSTAAGGVSDVCSAPAPAPAAAPGDFRVNTDSLNARIAPTTDCGRDVVQLRSGTLVYRTGTWGEWSQIRVGGGTRWVATRYLTSVPAPAASRLSGPTRYQTAIAVSTATHPRGAQTVYIASGEDYPDALTAGPAAAVSAGALLLSARSQLGADVRTELVRLAPSRVVIVGGEASVGASVASEIAAAVPGATVSRVSGGDRAETGRAVAKAAFTGSGTVYLAARSGFADAVSASAVAAGRSAPVLLIDGAAQAPDAATVDMLRGLGARDVVLIGGAATVDPRIDGALSDLGFAVTRYGGRDRYETNQQLTNASFGGSVPRAYVAAGADFPDVLTGSVLAGQQKAPLFTQPQACMTGAARDWMIERHTTTLVVIGGEGSISGTVLGSGRC